MPPPISDAVLKSLSGSGSGRKPAGVSSSNGPGPHTHAHAQAQGELLPKQFQQFQDRAYWDTFFKERKQEAFEWYGTYSELRPFVAKAAARGVKRERVLVIGCGNSDFSTELYVKGGFHRVVNVDFSAPVIEEMRRKTLAVCPEMEWRVMDVTAMAFEEGSFDVVLDKGTLDAIFSTPESAPQAHQMLAEVGRVLSANHGRYMVVTLGQDFILRKLLETFGSGEKGWQFDVHAVEDPAATSPFLTLVGIASRQSGQEGAGDEGQAQSGPVTLHFDASGRSLLDKDSLHFAAGDHAEVLGLVAMAQERAAIKHELREVEPGRFKGEIGIWLEQVQQQQQEEEASQQQQSQQGPRYTLSIVDLVPPTQTPLPCAVLIIPQGREHEWLFSTADGLRQVGQSAVYRRLICVRMNRGHRFKDMEEVKAELGPIVLDFVPVDRDPSYFVPFLAVGESIGDRSAVVATGELPGCGQYCVEEEEDEEDGGKGAVLRRLIFFRNQHVVQSEIRLVPPPASGKSGGGKKKGKGGGGKKSSGGKAIAAVAAAAEKRLVVDWSYLSFDYHRAILAGFIALTYPSLRRALKGEERRRCLVIGLGGGGLPLFLRRYVPCLDVTVVELEGGLAAVAEEWFGFETTADDNGGLRVDVGDGLERVLKGQTAEEKWDCIVVDVDNADASVGISCPAPAFLTPSFLEACRGRLTEEAGVLIMNVAARSSELLGGAIEVVEMVFGEGEVHEARPSEQDVNRVLFALKAPRSAAAAKLSLGVQTEKWLEECGVGGQGKKNVDPLGLTDMPIQKRG